MDQPPPPPPQTGEFSSETGEKDDFGTNTQLWLKAGEEAADYESGRHAEEQRLRKVVGVVVAVAVVIAVLIAVL